MFNRFFIPFVSAALLLPLAPRALADEGTRVGVCNPARVFEKLDEREQIQNRMTAERQKAQSEGGRRKAEIDEITKALADYKPNTPQYKEKAAEKVKKSIEFDVWARIEQGQLAEQEKDQVKALFDKIKEACKDVAREKKLDFVLAERQPDMSNTDSLTPDQVRQLIATQDVLYKNDKVDITQDVILLLNRKFAGAPAAGPSGGK